MYVSAQYRHQTMEQHTAAAAATAAFLCIWIWTFELVVFCLIYYNDNIQCHHLYHILSIQLIIFHRRCRRIFFCSIGISIREHFEKSFKYICIHVLIQTICQYDDTHNERLIHRGLPTIHTHTHTLIFARIQTRPSTWLGTLPNGLYFMGNNIVLANASRHPWAVL